MVQHCVNLEEIGECFYVWLDTLLSNEITPKPEDRSSIDFEGTFEEFPLPLTRDTKFTARDNKITLNKSSTLAAINQNLHSTSRAAQLIFLVENALETHFKAINEKNKKEDEHKAIPLKIKNKLDNFFEKGKVAATHISRKQVKKTSDKTAIIHIRHKQAEEIETTVKTKGKDQTETEAKTDRNLKTYEFNLLVDALKKQGFNKFILIGDLHQQKIYESARPNNKKKPEFLLLDYLKNGTDSAAMNDWLRGAKPLAKQIHLIRLIREIYGADLLIGRKSGAGLDMHAYAGMKTIFLDDAQGNERYAKKNEWSKPYLENLRPIYAPLVSAEEQKKNRNLNQFFNQGTIGQNIVMALNSAINAFPSNDNAEAKDISHSTQSNVMKN